jgi:hypothetical protein
VETRSRREIAWSRVSLDVSNASLRAGSETMSSTAISTTVRTDLDVLEG